MGDDRQADDDFSGRDDHDEERGLRRHWADARRHGTEFAALSIAQRHDAMTALRRTGSLRWRAAHPRR